MVTWLWVLVRGGADCAWVLLVLPRRAVRTWKSGYCLRPRFFQFLVRCLGVACGVQRVDFSGRVAATWFQQWIHILQEALDEFPAFSTLW